MAVDPEAGSRIPMRKRWKELLGDRSAGGLSLREASGGGTDVAVGDRVVAALSNPRSRRSRPLKGRCVHRSEITCDKGIEPTTLHHPGESVCVLITGLDQERGRISLSIQRPEEDRGVPSTSASLPRRRIETLSELVHSGDLVRVRVVAIDAERRRPSLSVGQALGNVVYATRTDQDANV